MFVIVAPLFLFSSVFIVCIRGCKFSFSFGGGGCLNGNSLIHPSNNKRRVGVKCTSLSRRLPCPWQYFGFCVMIQRTTTRLSGVEMAKSNYSSLHGNKVNGSIV